MWVCIVICMFYKIFFIFSKYDFDNFILQSHLYKVFPYETGVWHALRTKRQRRGRIPVPRVGGQIGEFFHGLHEMIGPIKFSRNDVHSAAWFPSAFSPFLTREVPHQAYIQSTINQSALWSEEYGDVDARREPDALSACLSAAYAHEHRQRPHGGGHLRRGAQLGEVPVSACARH
jgi:hypothetical protein